LIRVACCFLGLVSAPAFAQIDPADEPIEIRMIANMGVMISQGESKVLIDALFTDVYDGRFRVPTPEDREAMIHGHGEFEGVDAALFTHLHGDHFNADEVTALLTANSEALIAVSQQSADAITSIGTVLNPERLSATGPWLGAHNAYYLEAESFGISPRSLFHMRDVENIGYAVNFGETTFLHLGDTNPEQADFSVWDDVDIDVVLYPIWFAQSEAGQAALSGRWGNARHIALHIPAHISREQAVEFLGTEDVMVEAGERITVMPGDHD
jgi:L-ascorbate metabolism protein UlaG (beta-lactamase superfamily)